MAFICRHAQSFSNLNSSKKDTPKVPSMPILVMKFITPLFSFFLI